MFELAIFAGFVGAVMLGIKLTRARVQRQISEALDYEEVDTDKLTESK